MKRTYELIAPCHFGLEAVLKKEILDLGYEISLVEDGRVTFIGDDEAICRANVFLRTAERILLKAGSFEARTFDELFEGTKKIDWEELIPVDGKFWVAKASSIKSKLFSPSDIQSIMKKAMVERLKRHYGVSWFAETGASYPLRVFLYKDVVTIGIDTSGESLHKRGYRTYTSKAPITETLGGGIDSADALAGRPDSGGPLLRQRNLSHRSGYDGGEYGAGHEPQLSGGRVEESDFKEMLVRGGG